MYATPSNNYWLVGDQPPDVRWSSAQVTYVADTDSAYLAWVAEGYETSEIGTEAELAVLLNATYPAGSPIPPEIVVPTYGGNGPIWQDIIKATPTVILLRADNELPGKEEEGVPFELVPRITPYVRDGIKEEPGGIAPFSALSGNIVVPAGVYKLVITGQAAGGGGGGLANTAGPGSAGAGGPGETRRIIVEVEPGEIIPYTIGAEGTGGGNGANGTTAADLVIGAGAAVFPVVADSITGISASETSSPIPLPPGIVAGNLLVIFVTAGGGTITTPAGWTQLYHSGAVGTDACYWKIATGSEGSTVALVTSVSVIKYTIAHRITGHDPAVAPVTAIVSEGGSMSRVPNPPNLVAPWGSKSTLWIAAAHYPGGQIATGMPSTFDIFYPHNAVSTATKESGSPSLNPGNFSIPNISSWLAVTMAIAPLTPASLMICKGGLFGGGNPGGSTGANGATPPTGSGGIRIEPQLNAYSTGSAGGAVSVGGATLFGQCPVRTITTAGAFPGIPGHGYGSGGGGAVHQNTTPNGGGAGAPGMILIEGYGLDA